jgi:hypothetical protein
MADEQLKSPGQVAYEAYRGGDVTTPDGKVPLDWLPPWEDVVPEVQRCWETAAHALQSDFSAWLRERPDTLLLWAHNTVSKCGASLERDNALARIAEASMWVRCLPVQTG